MRTVELTGERELKELLEGITTCYLGMSDIDSQPYVVPMNFGIVENKIILHSAPTGRMIDILRRNPKVCVTFCTKDTLKFQDEKVACSYRVEAISVVVEGVAEFIDDFDTKIELLNGFMKNYTKRKFKYGAPAIKNVTIFTVDCREWSAKHFGHSVEKGGALKTGSSMHN